MISVLFFQLNAPIFHGPSIQGKLIQSDNGTRVCRILVKIFGNSCEQWVHAHMTLQSAISLMNVKVNIMVSHILNLIVGMKATKHNVLMVQISVLQEPRNFSVCKSLSNLLTETWVCHVKQWGFCMLMIHLDIV